jgi:hypothetical protein
LNSLATDEISVQNSVLLPMPAGPAAAHDGNTPAAPGAAASHPRIGHQRPPGSLARNVIVAEARVMLLSILVMLFVAALLFAPAAPSFERPRVFVDPIGAPVTFPELILPPAEPPADGVAPSVLSPYAPVCPST